MKLTGVIQAGGRSTRMGGEPKALLEVGGRRIVERVADVLGQVTDDLLMVTNTPELFEWMGLPMVPDAFPDCGSLGGIYSGLKAAPGEAAFTVACDNDEDDGTGPVVTPEDFTAELTGAAERPTPVVTTATGTATITFTPASSSTAASVAYSVTVQGLTGPATVAHIHGPAGVDAAASPIVSFNVTTTSTTSGIIAAGVFTSTGHATINMDSLAVLLRNGNAYVNVHTAANPNGEIRGQIVP